MLLELLGTIISPIRKYLRRRKTNNSMEPADAFRDLVFEQRRRATPWPLTYEEWLDNVVIQYSCPKAIDALGGTRITTMRLMKEGNEVDKRIAAHEWIELEVYFTYDQRTRTFTLERLRPPKSNPSTPRDGPRNHFQISSDISADAVDWSRRTFAGVLPAPDGIFPGVAPRSQSYRVITYKFTREDTVSLPDAVLLAQAISSQSPNYMALGSNCYWFAYMFFVAIIDRFVQNRGHADQEIQRVEQAVAEAAAKPCESCVFKSATPPTNIPPTTAPLPTACPAHGPTASSADDTAGIPGENDAGLILTPDWEVIENTYRSRSRKEKQKLLGTDALERRGINFVACKAQRPVIIAKLDTAKAAYEQRVQAAVEKQEREEQERAKDKQERAKDKQDAAEKGEALARALARAEAAEAEVEAMRAQLQALQAGKVPQIAITPRQPLAATA